MRKILGITLALASLGTTAFATEHKSTQLENQTVTIEASAAPQWGRNRNDRNMGRGRTKSVTRTRVVRQGRRVYRETYVVRYFPNGRSDTRLISRVRVS